MTAPSLMKRPHPLQLPVYEGQAVAEYLPVLYPVPEPDYGCVIRRIVRQGQANEPHEQEVVSELLYHLDIREIVEPLEEKDLEQNQGRIGGSSLVLRVNLPQRLFYG